MIYKALWKSYSLYKILVKILQFHEHLGGLHKPYSFMKTLVKSLGLSQNHVTVSGFL